MFDNINISVIVPVYNAEKYLARCLESIINQTYKNIEIIIVNDGSTDSSENIIEDYAQKDSRIVAIHKENGGVSSARNKGIDTAKGKYITFVDSDDYISINMYSSMINVTMENDIDFTFCGFMQQTLSQTKHVKLLNSNSKILDENSIRDLVANKLAHNRLMRAPWNKLFKREIINSNKIRFSEKVEYGEDFIFNLEYLCHVNSVYYLAEPLYCYDNTSLGATNTSRNDLLVSGKLIYERLSACAERWGITSRKFKVESIGEYVFFARVQFRMNMNNSSKITIKEQYEKLKNIVYDKDFKDSITKNIYVLFLVFLKKNITCKLIILATVLRFPGLLLIKIWFHYIGKSMFNRKHHSRQNQSV